VIRLSVDFEHASRLWWESGGQELWEGIADALDGHAVVLDDTVAESWLEQARQIPGWDSGHEYAPHPIASRPVGEDDPDA
jgi:hypothetical protein